MFLTARAMHGLLRGCWAVSVCSLQGPRALGGSGGDESEPREGPQGSVSPLGSWLLFPGGGALLLPRRVSHLFSPHCVGSIILVWEEMIMLS